MKDTSQDIYVLIDADACPVREEIYKVALRHHIHVKVVSNSFLRILDHPLISRVLVDDSFDAADDYIAKKSGPRTIVITSDILLAQRVLKNDATVIAPTGKPFTKDSIGAAVALRAIMDDIRAGASGQNIGGPAPFTAKDRSLFLQTLHENILRLKRK